MSWKCDEWDVGFTPDLDEGESDHREDEDPEEEHGCQCGYYCMDCLGMSWLDFM